MARLIVLVSFLVVRVRSFLPPSALSFHTEFERSQPWDTSSSCGAARTASLQQITSERFPTVNGSKINGKETTREKVPFVIERVEINREQEFREISEMCIEVFFNSDGYDLDNNGNKKITPWKALQLAYLRNTQYSDLRTRKFFSSRSNAMFVARRVFTIPAYEALNTPSILDPTSIYNADCLRGTTNGDTSGVAFAYGEVLGFVEVTEKPFGLGAKYEGEQLRWSKGKGKGNDSLRPVLTNLSVKEDARKSGVGSKLVEACEDAVVSWKPPYREIVLQVEEDNPSAQRFYEKRGYKTLFADPASRRYDTSGLFLKNVRTTKICMRKGLEFRRARMAYEMVEAEEQSTFLQKLRNAIDFW